MRKNVVIFCIVFFINHAFAEGLITPIPLNDTFHTKKALLGKKLFTDPRLSKDNTVSCSSCHQLDAGGDDNLPVAIGIEGKTGTRNSPTVFNARYNFTQFWDGRVETLQEQAEGPIHNPVEMGSTFEEIVKKLSQDEEYQKSFKALYTDGVTAKNIVDAIVEFEKALITPNSRFDKFLRGDTSALSQREQEGFKAFKEYGCIGCHNGINLGGNLFQKIGLVVQYEMNISDLGRFSVTNDKKDIHVFKVPSLRNVELTAPYFHDGERKTLKEAVNFMVNYQIGLPLEESDIDNIVLFLETLTGETPKIVQDEMK